MPDVGDVIRLTVGPVAHGGHFVGRLEGQVVFVRHGLPGEDVVAVVTDIGPKGRYLRADVRSVEKAAPERVTAPCQYAGACGGCDFQHVDLALQRELKASVVAEQLRRLAGVDRDVVVEPLTADESGLGWRTRMSFAVDESGRPGLRRHRSHDVVAIDRCVISHPLIQQSEVTTEQFLGASTVDVTAATSDGDVQVSVDGSATPGTVERAAGRDWRVSDGGFWQVHPAAADALVAAVLDQLQPRAGEHALDLYAGVGLFAGPLAQRLGVGGRVDVVEAHRVAVEDAEFNLADDVTVRIQGVSVERFLQRTPLRHCDLVVLDPPRAGAGRRVLTALARMKPRAISYVACDPAALARDVATAADLGYGLQQLRAFDLFPMTHHVECVALLSPMGEQGPG